MVRVLPPAGEGSDGCRHRCAARERTRAGRPRRVPPGRQAERPLHRQVQGKGRNCGQAGPGRDCLHHRGGPDAPGFQGGPRIVGCGPVALHLHDRFLPLRAADADRALWRGACGAGLGRRLGGFLGLDCLPGSSKRRRPAEYHCQGLRVERLLHNSAGRLRRRAAAAGAHDQPQELHAEERGEETQVIKINTKKATFLFLSTFSFRGRSHSPFQTHTRA
mmetsp:Transcript_5463/g.19071  ORF Transcript_5463/g.19071 Transcript_5463/m.19071 type:complete len:219 (+) Transcript_5463:1130-1786(+)